MSNIKEEIYIQQNFDALSLSNRFLSKILNFKKCRKTRTIWCYNNYLIGLKKLPPLLRNLYCHNSCLTKLPKLPVSLISLSCNNNNLKKLPRLPKSLTSLWFDNITICKSRRALKCLQNVNNHKGSQL